VSGVEPFESSRRGLRATGASTGDRDIVEWITRHGKAEGALLERYERFAREASSPLHRYLVKLIIEDERRHHVVLAEIAEAIAWGGVHDARPSIPRPVEGGADAELIEETKKLLASEKSDRAELRRLRRRLRSYSGTIWPLLIDLMLRDTQKHTRILRYIVRHRPG
jgi:rubrerythrin